jgi:hypothetical protein|eukprot:Stramenopile-MAST_4_protein_1914
MSTGGARAGKASKAGETFDTLLDYLHAKVGRAPVDSIGWLYVARGCYKKKRYDWAFSALCQPEGPLNDENAAVRKEAQHLMAFSLYRQNQFDQAKKQFAQSVKEGNETDWQMVVEIGIDHGGKNSR